MQLPEQPQLAEAERARRGRGASAPVLDGRRRIGARRREEPVARARAARAARRRAPPARRRRAAGGASQPRRDTASATVAVTSRWIVARVREAHLPLRGVDVHVHPAGGHAQEQQRGREAPARQHVAIHLEQRVPQQPVAHRPRVHEQVDAAPGRRGAGRAARRRPRARGRRRRARPARARRPRARRARRRSARAGLPPRASAGVAFVALHVEVHAGQRERSLAQPLAHVAPLGHRGLQELAPRGHGAEQLVHLDPGALRRGGGARLDPPAGLDPELEALLRPARARDAAGGGRPRRWPAAPRRGSRSSGCRPGLGARAQLAGGVALERERGLARASCPSRRRSRAIERCRPRARPPGCARAPASRAFSTSSFTTEAGRSTTSPAAIWSTSASGSRSIEAEAWVAFPPARRAYHGTGRGVNPASLASPLTKAPDFQ